MWMGSEVPFILERYASFNIVGGKILVNVKDVVCPSRWIAIG